MLMDNKNMILSMKKTKKQQNADILSIPNRSEKSNGFFEQCPKISMLLVTVMYELCMYKLVPLYTGLIEVKHNNPSLTQQSNNPCHEKEQTAG